MKVENSTGREYYLQRSKDNRIAQWCTKTEPAQIEIDGAPVEAYGNPEKSDWIYLRYEGTAYCLWAKDPRDFEFLDETSLRITDRGRSKRSNTSKAEPTPVRAGKSSEFQMGKEEETPTREDLDAVLLHLPRLREEVESRMSDPNIAEGLYTKEFSSAVRQVVKAFFRHRFMFPFNYQPWMDEARKLEENRELLAKADLDTLRKLVVVHWRQDYWDYDNAHWEFIAANGHLVALLERLDEIAGGMPPVQSSQTDSDKFTWSDGDISDITFPEALEDTEGLRFVPPGVERYIAAFEAIQDKITDKQMLMLRAHYHSGGRAVTMRELATASGYADYKIANIQYGSLAKRLMKAMELDAPLYKEKDPIWLLGIAELVNRSDFGLEWHFVMRQEVARALEDLEIV